MYPLRQGKDHLRKRMLVCLKERLKKSTDARDFTVRPPICIMRMRQLAGRALKASCDRIFST